MKFDNRPPIDLESAEKLASASRDGGCYDGIGYDIYRVYKGKKIHLIHLYSSGCERNNKVDSSSTHLGIFETLDALVEYLRKQFEPCGYGMESSGSFPWWCSELLEELNVEAEQA